MKRTLLLLALTLPASAQTQLFRVDGTEVDSRFAEQLANAGDVDGDGFDDVILGSPMFGGQAGHVEVRSGATGALVHSWSGTPGTRLRYGQAVTGVGDLDGDGHAEIAFSAPDFDALNGPARVFVKDGATGNNVATIDGSNPNEFGWSLAGGGDSDGDGKLELLIGEPGFDGDAALSSWGRIWKYEFGGPFFVPEELRSFQTPSPAGFGHTLAWIDVDLDGNDDVAIGLPSYRGTGTLTIPMAGAVGIYDGSFAFAHGVVVGTLSGGRLGSSLAPVGDIDGDGKPDLAVSAPGAHSESGRVTIYRGFDQTLLRTRAGDAAGDAFGISLASLGDVTGDGTPDLAVGASGDGEGFTGFTDSGEVHIVSGFDLSTVSSRRGGEAHAHLGRSVVSLGDVTGDGVRDIAASAPYANVAQTDEPGALLLFDTLGEPARCSAFGQGTPGTQGVPSLQCTALPLLGTSTDLLLSNSSGTPQLGGLLAGRTPALATVFGGTLYLAPQIVQLVASVPTGGASFPLAIPQDHALSGELWLVQGLQIDSGAPGGVSFTRPIELVFGGR